MGFPRPPHTYLRYCGIWSCHDRKWIRDIHRNIFGIYFQNYFSDFVDFGVTFIPLHKAFCIVQIHQMKQKCIFWWLTFSTASVCVFPPVVCIIFIDSPIQKPPRRHRFLDPDSASSFQYSLWLFNLFSGGMRNGWDIKWMEMEQRIWKGAYKEPQVALDQQ